MINFLIDTYCWNTLLQEEDDANLSKIEYWGSNKSARLLIPLRLDKEWQKQKVV
jgi:hypothetical protein